MKDTLKLVLLLLLFGALPAAQLSGQSCFGLKLASHTAEPGETVCVDVSVAGFTNILGFQFSIQWNSAELQFLSTTDYNLSGLIPGSFGTPAAGALTSTWNDPNVQSVTLPDGAVIFSACFQVLAPLNTSTNIGFANTPTSLEFITNTLDVVDEFVLIGSNIFVSTGNDAPLSIESACVQAANCLDHGAFEATLGGGDGPPYSWSWNGAGSNTTTTTAINDTRGPGLHNLTVSDGSGKTVGAVVSTGSSPLSLLDYTITPIICNGPPGSISIESVGGASGNLSYLWSTGATSSSITVTTQGTYDVTISDALGCTLEESFYVPDGNNAFTVTESITPPVCDLDDTGAINLSVAPAGDYTFAWSNNSNTQNLTGIPSGTYSVTVTNTQTNCEVVEVYNMAGIGLVILYGIEGCNSPNDSVTLQAIPFIGTHPFTHLWSNGATTPTIEVPNVNGSVYTVTVTDANGCSEIASQTVSCLSGQATLSLTGATVNPGESFCLDVAISNTIPVGAMALELNWDANILQFDSMTNLQMPSPQLAGWSISEPGVLDFLWSDISMPYPAQTQPAPLMQVCFIALQPGSTAVTFSADPSETYLLEEALFQHLALFTTGNTVTVSGNSQRAIGIRGTEVQATQSDLVCVEVKATNFEEVTRLSYDMTWDTDQLEFNFISNFLPASGLSLSDFDLATDGLIRLDWEAASGESMTIGNDTTIYEVCFNAIGEPGSYPVQWSNLLAQNADALDLAIQSIAGKVVITPSGSPAPMELSLAPGAVIEAGEHACIPVEVVQFDGIYAMQLSIGWDQTLIRLDSVQTADLTAVSLSANFGYFPAQGKLSFSWIDPALTTGVTLAPGDALFNVCFTAIGPSGISTLTFENAPTLIEVINSDNEEIPLLGQGGFVIVPDQNVWPGDTDNNGHVNHFDLLPVGIGFGAAGPQRANATIDWVGQPADDWTQYTPSSAINYKHIDTDGNGAIADADTLAISQNWGLSVNPFLPEAPIFEPRVGVPLYVLADTLAPSEVAALDIVLGTEDFPAENVYGIAFSITYNPELIVPGSVSASFLNSWLGEPNNDLISLFRVSPTQDRIDIAITRTDGLNNSGNGAIGKLHITIEDVIFRNTIFRRAEFGIENVRLIERDELEIPVAPEYTTSWVSVSTSTDNPELANSIHLYPTPASNALFVKTEGLKLLGILVLDQVGRVVANFDQPDNGMDISQVPAGIYVAKVATDRGVAHKQIVVVR
ncbi:MAG: T9SS type A sorting domain-containing protein [Saprospiraceae bacterium]